MSVRLMRIVQWVLLLILGLGSLFIGVQHLSLEGLRQLDSEQFRLLFISRFPRLLSILITGASLSIAGLIMQSVTRNRFVSPTTAGTMEWCRFGVMLAILLFPGSHILLRVGLAFVVSLLGTSLFLVIIGKMRSQSIILVPLAGMMLGSVVNSVATYFAYQYDIVQNMTSWLQGNFSLIIKGNYELLYFSLPFMVLGYLYADRFTIAGMGKNMTTSLGLNHAQIMRIGLAIVAFISAVTIVGVGNIPFLGLVVPNLVSIYRGDSIKNTLFDVAWLGAILVLICDIVGRVLVFPAEIPIGIIFSVIGGALFLAILFRRQSHAA